MLLCISVDNLEHLKYGKKMVTIKKWAINKNIKLIS